MSNMLLDHSGQILRGDSGEGLGDELFIGGTFALVDWGSGTDNALDLTRGAANLFRAAGSRNAIELDARRADTGLELSPSDNATTVATATNFDV